MAGFKTHITVSTTVGVGYAAGAYAFFGVPESTCLLAGGLCSVSGMLPDVDSDSGVPFRESMAFAAAVIPMLMLDRFQRLGMSNEMTAIAGAFVYLFIRFGVARVLRRYTVHRGMWHSIPAMLLAGEVAFLVCSSGGLEMRLYKAGAVMLGFFSHLLLDEIYSVKWTYTGPRLKKSFGTALKFWSRSLWGNFSTYAKVILFGMLALNDPIWADAPPQAQQLHRIASSTWDRLIGSSVTDFEQRIERGIEQETEATENAFLPRDSSDAWGERTPDGGLFR